MITTCNGTAIAQYASCTIAPLFQIFQKSSHDYVLNSVLEPLHPLDLIAYLWNTFWLLNQKIPQECSSIFKFSLTPLYEVFTLLWCDLNVGINIEGIKQTLLFNNHNSRLPDDLKPTSLKEDHYNLAHNISIFRKTSIFFGNFILFARIGKFWV